MGTTTVTRAPSLDDAYARPSPWLPAEEATTSRPGSSSNVADTAARPPRTLNEPVGWSVSIFTETEGPSWGIPKVGVTGRKRRTAFHAASMWAGPGATTSRTGPVWPAARLAC